MLRRNRGVRGWIRGGCTTVRLLVLHVSKRHRYWTTSSVCVAAIAITTLLFLRDTVENFQVGYWSHSYFVLERFGGGTDRRREMSCVRTLRQQSLPPKYSTTSPHTSFKHHRKHSYSTLARQPQRPPAAQQCATMTIADTSNNSTDTKRQCTITTTNSQQPTVAQLCTTTTFTDSQQQSRGATTHHPHYKTANNRAGTARGTAANLLHHELRRDRLPTAAPGPRPGRRRSRGFIVVFLFVRWGRDILRPHGGHLCTERALVVRNRGSCFHEKRVKTLRWILDYIATRARKKRKKLSLDPILTFLISGPVSQHNRRMDIV